MNKHLVFHRYKWETYHIAPVFVSGLFQDYTRERRFQVGECSCGANKYREIDVNPELEMDIAFNELKLRVASELEKQGELDKAIYILKI